MRVTDSAESPLVLTAMLTEEVATVSQVCSAHLQDGVETTIWKLTETELYWPVYDVGAVITSFRL